MPGGVPSPVEKKWNPNTACCSEIRIDKAIRWSQLIGNQLLPMKVHKTPTYIKSLLHLLGGPEFVVVVSRV